MTGLETKKLLTMFAILGLTLFSQSVLATDYSSTNFKVKDPVIDQGQTSASSLNFGLGQSVGQTAIGKSTSTNFQLWSGFQYYFNQAAANPVGGSGGGGGGPGTSLNILGQAYPSATVILVYDALGITTTVADSSGAFRISMLYLPAGDYVFILYALDQDGNRSASLTFTGTLARGVALTKSDLLVSPTITTDYAIIKQGENIKLTGFGPPNTPIAIQVDSDLTHLNLTTQTNPSGQYSHNLNTRSLPLNQYETYAAATFQGAPSPNSLKTLFSVGDRSVIREKQPCVLSDLNCDGRVNLIDFSILLYFWEGAGDLRLNPRADIDGSGAVDLVDFSIMLYNWTG